MRVAGLGIALGASIVLFTGRWIRSLLFEVCGVHGVYCLIVVQKCEPFHQPAYQPRKNDGDNSENQPLLVVRG